MLITTMTQKMKLTKQQLREIILEELSLMVEVDAKQLIKKSKGSEKKFYDLLSNTEESMGDGKYYQWLSSELKKVGVNKKVDKYSQAPSEETLYNKLK